MTTAQFTEPTAPVGQPAGASPSEASEPARVSVRQPVSSDGFVDAAWWPRSRDLVAELPALMADLRTSGREVSRVIYGIHAWQPAPRELRIDGRRVRLGGFTSGEQHVVRLTDAWRSERTDVLVIAPDTDPAVAERALRLAAVAEQSRRPEEILQLAAHPADEAT